jgi:hypothetical protein
MSTGSFKKTLSKQTLKDLRSMKEANEKFYLNLLSEAQNQGEIVNMPLDALLFCVNAAIDGAITHYRQMESQGVVKSKDSERLLKYLKEFVFRALSSH